MNTDYKTMLITGTTQGIGYQLYKYYKDKYNIITINRKILATIIMSVTFQI